MGAAMLSYKLFLLVIAVSSASESATRGAASVTAREACPPPACPAVQQPVCARLVARPANTTTYVVLVNKCEINYVKCHKGLEGAVVPMKNCAHGRIRRKRLAKSSRKRAKRDAEASPQFDAEIVQPLAGVSYEAPNLPNMEEVPENVGEASLPDVLPPDHEEHSNAEGDYEGDAAEDEGNAEDNEDESFEKKGQAMYDPDGKVQLHIQGNGQGEPGVGDQEAIETDAEDAGEGEAGDGGGGTYGETGEDGDNGEDVEDGVGDGGNKRDEEGDAYKGVGGHGGTQDEPANYPVYDEYVNRAQYDSACPLRCPLRDVMVCARCQHGVYRSFLTVCHLRMFGCQHADEKLSLVSREPCVQSAPFLSGGAPLGRVREPHDHDPVLRHLRCQQLSYASKEADPRCSWLLPKKQEKPQNMLLPDDY